MTRPYNLPDPEGQAAPPATEPSVTAGAAYQFTVLPHGARVVPAGFVIAVQDVIEGRGMFGVDPHADLEWAVQHLDAAMRQIAGEKE